MALEIFFFCGIPLVSLMHAKSALHNLTNQTFIKPQKPSMHKRMVVGQRDSLVGSFAPEFLVSGTNILKRAFTIASKGIHVKSANVQL